MAGPFDFVSAVLEKRDDPVAAGELDISGYVPRIVNTACSFRLDAVHAAQIVNLYYQLPPIAQYTILRVAIRKRRSSKDEYWVKQAKAGDAVAAAMDIYGVGRAKAEEITRVLGAEKLIKMNKDRAKK